MVADVAAAVGARQHQMPQAHGAQQQQGCYTPPMSQTINTQAAAEQHIQQMTEDALQAAVLWETAATACELHCEAHQLAAVAAVAVDLLPNLLVR